MSDQNENISRDEMKKEFQLERMILFSDAVFAIVITLMAIEIRVPDLADVVPENYASELISHLAPVFLAYTVSFGFIGKIWYQHLKLFSVLRDYDFGLVLRNLVLLFFVGLFPFGATVIASIKGTAVALVIYLSIILLCISSQFFLQRYILIQRPQLRNTQDISAQLNELERKKVALISFIIILCLIILSIIIINDEKIKSIVMLWMLIFPVLQRLLKKNKK